MNYEDRVILDRFMRETRDDILILRSRLDHLEQLVGDIRNSRGTAERPVPRQGESPDERR